MSATNETFKMAVLFYGASYLPKLRRLTRDQVQLVAEQAGEASNRAPLHLVQAAEFSIPAWDTDRNLTGGQVTALMVFSIWVLCNEDEKLAAPLVASWPIKEACAIAPSYET